MQLWRGGEIHHLTLTLKTEAPSVQLIAKRVDPMIPLLQSSVSPVLRESCADASSTLIMDISVMGAVYNDSHSRERLMPPAAIPVAISVGQDECGGPLIGLDGKVLGLVCDRYHSTFALVIPADRVVESSERPEARPPAQRRYPHVRARSANPLPRSLSPPRPRK